MEVFQITTIFYGLIGIKLCLLFSSDIANTKNLYWKKLNKKRINYSIEIDYKSISRNSNFLLLQESELLTAVHIDYGKILKKWKNLPIHK